MSLTIIIGKKLTGPFINPVKNKQIKSNGAERRKDPGVPTMNSTNAIVQVIKPYMAKLINVFFSPSF